LTVVCDRTDSPPAKTVEAHVGPCRGACKCWDYLTFKRCYSDTAWRPIMKSPLILVLVLVSFSMSCSSSQRMSQLSQQKDSTSEKPDNYAAKTPAAAARLEYDRQTEKV